MPPHSRYCDHGSPSLSSCLHPSLRAKPRSFWSKQGSPRLCTVVSTATLVFPQQLCRFPCYVPHPTGRLPLQLCDNRVSLDHLLSSGSMANGSSSFKSRLHRSFPSLCTTKAQALPPALGVPGVTEGKSTQAPLVSFKKHCL